MSSFADKADEECIILRLHLISSTFTSFNGIVNILIPLLTKTTRSNFKNR